MTGPQYFRTSSDEASAYVEAALLDASSSTSKAIPALGDTVTMTIGTGKEVPPGSIWKFAYTGDASNNFNLLVQSYASGDVTGVCIVTNGSGTYASWSAAHISAVTSEPGTTGYTTTSITVPTDITTVSFTTQTGKAFRGGALGYLVSLDGTKIIYGQFSTYTSGTGAWSIRPIYATGSGSSSAWKVVQTTPSLTGSGFTGTNIPGTRIFCPNNGFRINSSTDGTEGVEFSVTPGGSGIFPELEIAMGGAGRVLTFAGDATISGTNTGDAGPMTTRGDTLYMNSTPAVARLPIGASGTVLKSDGTDVSWGSAVAWTTLSGSLNTGSTLDVAIPSTANEVIIQWNAVSTGTGSRDLRIQALTAASTPDATAANYQAYGARDSAGAAAFSNSVASFIGTTGTSAASDTIRGVVHITGMALNSGNSVMFQSSWHGGPTIERGSMTGNWNNATQMYGIRFLISGSGSFDGSGTYEVHYR